MNQNDHLGGHLEQVVCLLEGLQSAPNEKALKNVITLALLVIDHDDEKIHDLEVKIGAPEVIIDLLRKAVYISFDYAEAHRLCLLLDHVYKCSYETLLASFCENASILFPLLIMLSSRPETNVESKDAASRLLKRTLPHGLPLNEVKDADILLIAIVRYLRSESVQIQNKALVAMDVITLESGSRAIASRFPGLLEVVVASASFCQELALDVIANVSMDMECKEVLSNTLGCADLLSCTLTSDKIGTKKKACAIILHLSSAKSSREILLQWKSGRLLTQLISLVDESLARGDSTGIQAITNLISEATADTFGGLPKLIDTIIEEISSNPISTCAIEASRLMMRLSRYLRPRHESHQNLFTALRRMVTIQSFDIALWTARSFIEQSLNLSCSFFMVRNREIIESLCILAQSRFYKIRAAAVSAIANLAQVVPNARKLSSYRCVVNILTLSLNRSQDDSESDDEIRFAIQAILLVANHHSASSRIAQHEGIIQSLCRYGTSSDGDIELKLAAFHGILMLAPSM